MRRQCPHCDYDMAGLPSEVCPECGKRYDPVRAAVREARRAAQGVQLADLLLLLAFLIGANLQGPRSAAALVATTGAWIWLRRRLLRRAPAALWLALLALMCAEGTARWRSAPPGLDEAFVVVSVGVVLTELVRFRLQTVSVLIRVAGGYFAVVGVVGFAIAIVAAAVGGLEGPVTFFGLEIETIAVSGCAVLALLSLLLAGLGWALWRAGAWVKERSGASALPGARGGA